MNRKDALKALFSPAPVPPLPTSPDHTPPTDSTQGTSNPAERTGSGAIRSMGLSLQKLSADAESVRAMRTQLQSGTHVVDLDPDSVDPSFVTDRLGRGEGDVSLATLVDSMAEHGQQVPVLVRPHPDEPGRFQIAYGHRRLRAAKTLGRKVRAVVRELDDRALVVAQGKENSERRDLSFIERALFAKNLEERGFDRGTIIAALSVDKAETARLLGVARSIPDELVQAVGPAPKAGRPRWLALAQLLGMSRSASAVRIFLADPVLNNLDTNARFNRLFYLLSMRQPTSAGGSFWNDRTNRPVVRIDKGAATTKLTVNERLAPAFGAFLIEKLDELYEAFEAQHRNDE